MTPDTVPAPPPEFSRIVNVDAIGAAGQTVRFSATSEECVALARRLGLVALEGLSGSAELRRRPGSDRMRLKVTFTADVLQSCVVSLEPFAARVSDSLSQDFLLLEPGADDPEDDQRAVEVSLESEPEVLRGSQFDLGEFVAQHLSLALDPYPRKPGVEFPGHSTEPGSESGRESGRKSRAFAELERLRRGGDRG